MTDTSNWYDDPIALEAEVRRTVSAHAAVPAIPGYSDLAEIARGGQGIVFSATQRSTRRKVAIKVLLNGDLASGPARRRFEREIDLVARLRHPNIVSVYDSGTTHDGRSFLVMEYVDGSALGDHGFSGATSRPHVREIVAAFAKVCDAVGFAHQRGVIHRDLKPRNIRIDASGEPRVLDFGLAKAVGERDHRATLSVTGQFMGSLPWASPEQAAGDPNAVDVRSDVYSLGVILYQWLTGAMPYDVGTTLADALRAITSAAPLSPARLKDAIDDDLATIVLMCLAKEPERRYQSAAELALDCRRYLAGEPIAARRDSAWYSLKKTAHRHRLVTIASVAVVLAALAALVVSQQALARATLASARATDQAALAEAASHRATDQAALSASISEFLTEMLGAADPDKDGRDVRVLTLLDRAASRIPERFADRPELAGSLHATLGSLYEKLSQFEPCRQQLQLAADAYAKALGPDSRQALHFAALAAVSLHKLGKPQEAVDLTRPILARQIAVLGKDDIDTVSTAGDLAQPLISLQKPAEAEKLLRDCIRAAESWTPPREDMLAEFHGRLGAALYDLDKLDESDQHTRRALEISERVRGPQHSLTLIHRNNLAWILLQRGKLVEAEAIFRQLVTDSESLYGPENESTLITINNLAKVIQDQGRLAEAEPMMKRILDIRLRTLGQENRSTLISLHNYASLLSLMKRFDDAIPLQRELLAIRLRLLGPDKTDTLVTMNALGCSLRDAGHTEEAEATLRDAATRAAASLGPEHHIAHLFNLNLGRALILLGKTEESAALIEPAADKIVAKYGPKHNYTKAAWTALLRLYEATGQAARASEFQAKLDENFPPAKS
ncbi:MAG: tetratricopeptide repeat protein [Phycisphaerales bacterium]